MDKQLYEHFKNHFWNQTPHNTTEEVVQKTDLIDISDMLIHCANHVYRIDISQKITQVFGKFETQLQSKSIKERPAYNIIHDAITRGKLVRNDTIIEATSGNFGISLSHLTSLGLDVIVLVSRKLQKGVRDALSFHGTKCINLDIDICPAPGMKGTLESLRAEVMYNQVRVDLQSFGYDISIYDSHKEEIYELLVAQDIINLAQLLASIYGWFCPKQYDNTKNYEAHLHVTGPEIAQQLATQSLSLQDFEILCTFGTGGTSYGLSEYVQHTYNKKNVHVVFPIMQQDVGGIRGRSNANGLRMYVPEKYKGIYEVDFEQAKYVMQYFVERGYDIGESSALSLYTAIQMANLGVASSFIVILPDGVQKYREKYDRLIKEALEISVQEAITHTHTFDTFLWIHEQYTLTKKGRKLLSHYFSTSPDKIITPTIQEIRAFFEQDSIPQSWNTHMADSRTLTVCRSGNTSLKATKIFSKHHVNSLSLQKGITSIIAHYDNNEYKLEDVLQVYQ